MSEVFNFIYRGGVTKENGVRYLTAETPPADDNSTKVPTTEWVKSNIPSIPSGNVAIWSRDFTLNRVEEMSCVLNAPSGGTFFCFGTVTINRNVNGSETWESGGTVIAGGGNLMTVSVTRNGSAWIATNNALAIKIA